mmetsp:Transcript_23269/g.40161  ORF Transcript_23269/g.40161 Transcript_23269/m.40161 type:complete len:240 (+) Transcript_23269:543-1262(+)
MMCLICLSLIHLSAALCQRRTAWRRWAWTRISHCLIWTICRILRICRTWPIYRIWSRCQRQDSGIGQAAMPVVPLANRSHAFGSTLSNGRARTPLTAFGDCIQRRTQVFKVIPPGARRGQNLIRGHFARLSQGPNDRTPGSGRAIGQHRPCIIGHDLGLLARHIRCHRQMRERQTDKGQTGRLCRRFDRIGLQGRRHFAVWSVANDSGDPGARGLGHVRWVNLRRHEISRGDLTHIHVR